MQPKYIFFSPQSDGAVSGAWEVSLDPRLLLPRGGDDRGVYWVYPGTSLTFTFERGWDPEWGDFDVKFDARLVPVGTPERPNDLPPGLAAVALLGEEASASQNRLGLEVAPPAPDGAWTIDVSSPTDGPYMLIEALTIGNAERALVIAGGGR